ncbi:zinc ribbon domain-containing protein [Enterococcus faecium]|uniref:zinc ribbon domain-containing protein n=1 Tax=Enterococcus faecium TaxID=1352 RepID=UPI003515E903
MNNVNKLKHYLQKYNLSISDIGTIIGAMIILSGVYIFKFIDINIPFIGHQTSSLAHTVQFIKQIASWGNEEALSADIINMIRYLQIFIVAMTILPIISIICSFIYKKSTKIAASLSSLIVAILYFGFHYILQDNLSSDTSIVSSFIFGIADTIIILGLVIMFIGSVYSLIQYLKKNNQKINVDFSKITKKQWTIAGGSTATIIVLIGIFFFINQMPKSIIDDVSVDFNGYNHQGTATLSGKYADKIDNIISKKKNISRSDFSVKLDKDSGLSNGDKVKIMISSNIKNSPVKSQTKTVTVSGLKKSTVYTIDDVLKDSPIQWIGFNHYGSAKINTDIYDTEDETTDLSNGDSITLTLNQDYIAQEATKGKILDGSDIKKVEVSGLEDSPKITNLDSLLSQIDTVARDDNHSTSYLKYTVTRQESYFIGTNINNSWLGDTNYDSAEFSVISIYKIDSKMDDRTSTFYKIYSYSNLVLNNNQVSVASLNSKNQYSDYNSFDSVQEAFDSLKSKYPSITTL